MSGIAHHPRPVAGRDRGERGSVIIEATFAVPIFFVLVLGLVDIGLGVLQTSQATSAAADGARVGLIGYARADVAASEDRREVEAAVRERLAGQAVDNITVRCLRQGTATVVSCAAADPDRDRIQVQVRWQWRPLSPVGHALPVQHVTGSSTMALVRQPLPAGATP